MDHMLFILSCCPVKDLDGSVVCFIRSELESKMALYPLLQNCAMDRSALLCMAGNKWQHLAARGMWGMSRRAVCVASINMLFGSLTLTPGAHFVMCVQCALSPRK